MERTSNLIQQSIFFDLSTGSIESDNTLFNADVLTVDELIRDTPILEQYLQIAKNGMLKDFLTLPMIEHPNHNLVGYFKFEFYIQKTDLRFVWKITDLNTVKENLFFVQQGNNEKEIINQLFFKGTKEKSSILSFIESQGDNYLVRLKKILIDISNNTIEFLPFIKHSYPDTWSTIPSKMLEIYGSINHNLGFKEKLEVLFEKYPSASLQIISIDNTEKYPVGALELCTHYLVENVLSFCSNAQIQIIVNANGNLSSVENNIHCDISSASKLEESTIIEQLIRFHLFCMEMNNHQLSLSIKDKSKFFSPKLSFEIYQTLFDSNIPLK